MDNESYFTLSNSSINAIDNYYSSDVGLTPAAIKYSKAAKYEEKVKVWTAISKFGISGLLITSSGLAIDQHIYKTYCLEQRLIPFIKRYHSHSNYIFWPNLASSHYATTVCDFLILEKIEFVEKFENPANLPECRPVENFWAILKGYVYEDAWCAKTLPELERPAYSSLHQKITKNELASFFSTLLPGFRSVGRNWVIEKR